jgi:hypothetical protein
MERGGIFVTVLEQRDHRRMSGSVDVEDEVARSGVKGPGRQMRAGKRLRANVLIALTWLALGVAALAVASVTPGIYATVGLAALATLFGLWVFWRHGHGRITATGIYNFSFALFVGFGGLYQVSVLPVGASPDAFLPAVACCYFLQVVTWLAFWTNEPPASDGGAEVNRQGTRWAVSVGFSLLLLAVLGSQLTARNDFQSIVGGAGFSGVALLAAGLLRGPGKRWWMSRGIIICAAFAIYAHFLFNGFGRIVLGSLGFALLIVLSHRTSGRLVKGALLLGTVPTVLILAKVRANVVEKLDPNVKENGLESIVGPLHSFTTLLNYNNSDLLPHDWGYTFWSTLVALVPRGIWPDKPIGFGSEIVPFINPHLVGTGHSDAALFFGEWLFNFGLPGLLIMVPAVGLLMRGLDHILARMTRFPLNSMHAVMRYTLAIVAAVGVIDFAWVGTFTYMARSGSRLLVLAVVFLVLVAAVGGDAERTRSGRNGHPGG